MEEVKIKECPFCGSLNIKVSAQEAVDGGDVLFFHCRDCDAFGPGADNFEEALELWNNRGNHK